WDTDWFWCSGAFGAQDPRVRRFWPRRWRRSDGYMRLLGLDRRYGIADRLDPRAGRPQRGRGSQDVEGAVERAGASLASVDRAGPEAAPFGLHLKNEPGLSYLVSAPGDLGLSRAYVSGDLDVIGAHPGDPYDALMAIKGGASGLKFRIPTPTEAVGLVRSVG